MAIVPGGRDVRTVSPAATRDPGVRATPQDFGAQEAVALDELSNVLTNLGEAFKKQERATDLGNLETEALAQLKQFEFDEAKNPDWKGSDARFQAKKEEIFGLLSEKVSDPVVGKAFENSFNRKALTSEFNVKTGARRRQIQESNVSLSNSLIADAAIAANTADPTEREQIRADYFAKVNAAFDTGLKSAVEAQALKDLYDKREETTRAGLMIRDDAKRASVSLSNPTNWKYIEDSVRLKLLDQAEAKAEREDRKEQREDALLQDRKFNELRKRTERGSENPLTLAEVEEFRDRGANPNTRRQGVKPGHAAILRNLIISRNKEDGSLKRLSIKARVLNAMASDPPKMYTPEMIDNLVVGKDPRDEALKAELKLAAQRVNDRNAAATRGDVFRTTELDIVNWVRAGASAEEIEAQIKSRGLKDGQKASLIKFSLGELDRENERNRILEAREQGELATILANGAEEGLLSGEQARANLAEQNIGPAGFDKVMNAVNRFEAGFRKKMVAHTKLRIEKAIRNNQSWEHIVQEGLVAPGQEPGSGLFDEIEKRALNEFGADKQAAKDRLNAAGEAESQRATEDLMFRAAREGLTTKDEVQQNLDNGLISVAGATRIDARIDRFNAQEIDKFAANEFGRLQFEILNGKLRSMDRIDAARQKGREREFGEIGHNAANQLSRELRATLKIEATQESQMNFVRRNILGEGTSGLDPASKAHRDAAEVYWQNEVVPAQQNRSEDAATEGLEATTTVRAQEFNDLVEFARKTNVIPASALTGLRAGFESSDPQIRAHAAQAIFQLNAVNPRLSKQLGDNTLLQEANKVVLLMRAGVKGPDAANLARVEYDPAKRKARDEIDDALRRGKASEANNEFLVKRFGSSAKLSIDLNAAFNELVRSLSINSGVLDLAAAQETAFNIINHRWGETFIGSPRIQEMAPEKVYAQFKDPEKDSIWMKKDLIRSMAKEQARFKTEALARGETFAGFPGLDARLSGKELTGADRGDYEVRVDQRTNTEELPTYQIWWRPEGGNPVPIVNPNADPRNNTLRWFPSWADSDEFKQQQEEARIRNDEEMEAAHKERINALIRHDLLITAFGHEKVGGMVERLKKERAEKEAARQENDGRSVMERQTGVIQRDVPPEVP